MGHKSTHHVRPLRLDGEDQKHNLITIEDSLHIELHRLSDLSWNLDNILSPYQKELNSSLITMSLSWSLSANLMQEFCKNIIHFPKDFDKLIYESLYSSLEYHISRYGLYAQEIIPYISKQIQSNSSAQVWSFDYGQWVTSVISLEKWLHMRVSQNLFLKSKDLQIPIKQDISYSDDRVCLIPLSLKWKYHESNFVDSGDYWSITVDTIKQIYGTLKNSNNNTSINQMLNKILHHYFSQDMNMVRARRAARKISNWFFIMWENQRSPWKRAQSNYFNDAEKKLQELGLKDVWDQCEKHMKEQARKNWKRYQDITWDKEQFNSTHWSFDQYHTKFIDYDARMWEYLRKVLNFDLNQSKSLNKKPK